MFYIYISQTGCRVVRFKRRNPLWLSTLFDLNLCVIAFCCNLNHCFCSKFIPYGVNGVKLSPQNQSQSSQSRNNRSWGTVEFWEVPFPGQPCESSMTQQLLWEQPMWRWHCQGDDDHTSAPALKKPLGVQWPGCQVRHQVSPGTGFWDQRVKRVSTTHTVLQQQLLW